MSVGINTVEGKGGAINYHQWAPVSDMGSIVPVLKTMQSQINNL